MTQEEFYQMWMNNNKIEKNSPLHDKFDFIPAPCDCGENDCEGWQMLTPLKGDIK